MRMLEDIARGPLRLYSFVNYYLSDLQRGLQTAHLVSELFEKYQYSSAGAALTLSRWSTDYKTIIILNGGNCNALRYTYNILTDKSCGYPFSLFEEDQDSLNGALTCTGIIFPEFTKQDVEDYAYAADGEDNFIDLMRLIRSCPLA